jgi:hypothetical protein
MKPSIPVQRLTVLGLVLLIGFGALHRSHSCQPYPPTVRIEAIDPNASEVGPNTGTFRIYRTGGDSSLPLVVYFQEPEGTAQQGNDYEFAPDSMPAYVTIPAWSSYADVTVTPILDTDCYEGTETVILTLATNANYWIGWPSNATVNIADLTCDADHDSDGLPDVWELQHFGNLNQRGEDDFDQDGFSNLEEYLSGDDPNTIVFYATFENLHVADGPAVGHVTVVKGVPAKMALLVDTTDFESANWDNFASTFHANMAATDGPHSLYLGLKGRAQTSVPTWVEFKLYRDTTPPLVVVTNPAQEVVFHSFIQLEGYSTEPVAWVRYDLNNEAGAWTDLEGYVVDKAIDPDSFEVSTNWFACFDIPLTNGANSIVLRVSDLAGNVATNQLTFYYAVPTEPPVLNLWWPQDGANLSGTDFVIRGWVSDPTAEVFAELLGQEATGRFDGIVERNGTFWIQGLPLTASSNAVKVTVLDAGENAAVTNFVVFRSPVDITIEPLSPFIMNNPFVTVRGTINASDYKLWVNGVEATLASGTWQAEGVPLPAGGTALIQVRAIPLSDNNGHGTGGGDGIHSTYDNLGNPDSAHAVTLEMEADKPPAIVTRLYRKDLDPLRLSPLPPDGYQEIVKQNIGWGRALPGYYFSDLCWGGPEVRYYSWCDERWDQKIRATIISSSPRLTTNACGVRWEVEPRLDTGPGEGWLGEFCKIGKVQRLERDIGGSLWLVEQVRSAKTEYDLLTGGKASINRQSLFVLTGEAQGVGNFFWPERDTEKGAYAIPPTAVVLGSLGVLGTDSRLYKALPDGQRFEVTPRVEGNPYYTHYVGQTVHKPVLFANGVALEPDKVVDGAEFCVGQRIQFSYGWRWDSPYFGAPPGMTNTTFDWLASAKCVNAIKTGIFIPPNCINCESLPTFYGYNADLWRTMNPSAWWISGGLKHVRVTTTNYFANGQVVRIRQRCPFKIYRPRVQFPYTPLRPITISLNGNRLGAVAEFNALITSKTPFTGVANWTQLITRENNNYFCYGPLPCPPGTTEGRERLDGQEFYNDENTPIIPRGAVDPNPRGTLDFYDGPYVECFFNFTVRDSFRTFVRFKPDGQDSIWVTLGVVHWGWGATKSGDTILNPTTDTPEFQPTDEFPSWEVRTACNAPP